MLNKYEVLMKVKTCAGSPTELGFETLSPLSLAQFIEEKRTQIRQKTWEGDHIAFKPNEDHAFFVRAEDICFFEVIFREKVDLSE